VSAPLESIPEYNDQTGRQMHAGNRKNPQNMGKIIQPNTIHATGIFTYIWLIFTVNVGKDTIHGWYGQQNSESTKVVIQIGNKFARFHIYSSFAEFRKKKASHIS